MAIVNDSPHQEPSSADSISRLWKELLNAEERIKSNESVIAEMGKAIKKLSGLVLVLHSALSFGQN